jgi:hypothetical protein
LEAATGQKGFKLPATLDRLQAFASQSQQARVARRALPGLAKRKRPDFNESHFMKMIHKEIARLMTEIGSLNARTKWLSADKARQEKWEFEERELPKKRSRSKLQRLKELCQDE